VGVTFGGADAGMAKKFLNVADVGAAFKKVDGKGMAETVNRDDFCDFGAANSFVDDVSSRTNCYWASPPTLEYKLIPCLIPYTALLDKQVK